MTAADDEGRADAFWSFSLAVYGRDGVAPACIALQDRRGVDVNLLLFACWVAASGRGALDANDVAAALAVAAPWQTDVVAPLRRVRRRLNTVAAAAAVAATRQRLRAVEIEAEHIEQRMIAATCARTPDDRRPPARRAADAAEGLAAYLGVLGLAADADDVAALTALLDGAFPDFGRAGLEEMMKASLCAPG